MGDFCWKTISILVAGGLLISCEDAPVAYNSDHPGAILHQISTDPSEIFRNKVDREVELEARGVEPPVGNASWHDYWVKMIAYWAGPDGVGSHQEVAGYIVQQRRAHSLAPL